MAFVLTGKDDWRQWSRSEIENALGNTGSSIRAKIVSTFDILVSSRRDTQKAKAALAHGCQIITYRELHAALLVGRIANNQYLDDIDDPYPPAPPEPKPTVIDMTPMEALDGWGSF